MSKFKEPTASRNQLILMPQSLDEMVSGDEPVRLLCEVMDRLDYSKLEASYPGGGCSAYPPIMLVKILVFAYSQGMRSSRKIAESLRVDLRYLWIAEGLKPDFRTLARFRKEKGEYLQDLFEQSVRLCSQAGLVLLNYVAIDGTKVESSSGRDALWTVKRIEKEKDIIRKILEEAEQIDEQEDSELGDQDTTKLSGKLKDAEERKKLLDRAEKALKESGQKAISLTDPEARQMHTRAGIRMSYNVQAAVDSEHQVVVGVKVVQDPTDQNQFTDMLKEVYRNTGFKADMVCVDKGYYSYANLTALKDNAQPGVIPIPRQPSGKDTLSQFKYDNKEDTYICCGGKSLTFRGIWGDDKNSYRVYRCSDCKGCEQSKVCKPPVRGKGIKVNTAIELREKMKELLSTKEGKQAISLRKEVVEPVFGQMKENRQFRRFRLKGVAGAWTESWMAFLTHNLLKVACT